MRIFNFFLISICSALTLNALAVEPSYFTVSLDTFKEGGHWIWSYSEKESDSDIYKKPYLFEKYEVVRVQGSSVTIEMSSSPDKDFKQPAHHKFTADVEQCLEYGLSFSEQRLRSWRIIFYTRSLSPKWKQVSKKFKNLAFTEKFNCFPELKTAEPKIVNVGNLEFSAYQTPQKEIQTWYVLHDSVLAGVGVVRTPRDYKIKLLELK